jgi:hypothetical protein
MSLHNWHSKVRMWKPKWLGVICASIVTLLQIGHSGRKDMVARLYQAGAQHSQSPVRCRYKADDRHSLQQNEPPSLFNFAQFINSSQKN